MPHPNKPSPTSHLKDETLCAWWRCHCAKHFCARDDTRRFWRSAAVSVRENLCTRDASGGRQRCHCVKMCAHETILAVGSGNLSPAPLLFDARRMHSELPPWFDPGPWFDSLHSRRRLFHSSLERNNSLLEARHRSGSLSHTVRRDPLSCERNISLSTLLVTPFTPSRGRGDCTRQNIS